LDLNLASVSKVNLQIPRTESIPDPPMADPWDFVSYISTDNTVFWRSSSSGNFRYLEMDLPEKGKPFVSSSVKAEFEAVVRTFKHFMGPRAESFQIDKIVAIENQKHIAEFKNEYNALRRKPLTQPWRQENDMELLEWRDWISQHLSLFSKTVCGDESVNLVMAWHGGASSNAAFSIVLSD
jgi:hypothetical protein